MEENYGNSNELVVGMIEESAERLTSLTGEEREKEINNFAKLYDAYIKEYKVEADRAVAESRNEAQKLNDRIEQAIKVASIVATVGLGVGGWIVYGHMMRLGYIFEEEGALTSTTFREAKRFAEKMLNKPRI